MKILREERGQATIFVAVFMALAFLGMAALAIDVGMLYREKRMVQAAADAAAIAASAQYGTTAITTSAPAAAQQQAGILASGNNAAIITPHLVSVPNSDVQVVVTQPTHTFFLGAFLSKMGWVNVSAFAEASKINQPCLNTNDLTLNSGASITDAAGSTCGINDNDSDTLSLNSGATVNVGSFTDHGSDHCNSCSNITPMPTTGTKTVADPYKSLAAPAQPSTSSTNLGTLSSTTTLQPGTYSGLSLNGGSGTYTVTLNPGLYYFTGDLNINSNVTITGSGVTLYFASGTITMNSSATVNLTAPTSALSDCASCAGMLIWQSATDSICISAIRCGMDLDSGTSASWGGVVYVPDATLTLNSGSTAAAFGMIYANSVTVEGSITLGCVGAYCPSSGQVTLIR